MEHGQRHLWAASRPHIGNRMLPDFVGVLIATSLGRLALNATRPWEKVTHATSRSGPKDASSSSTKAVYTHWLDDARTTSGSHSENAGAQDGRNPSPQVTAWANPLEL